MNGTIGDEGDKVREGVWEGGEGEGGSERGGGGGCERGGEEGVREGGRREGEVSK